MKKVNLIWLAIAISAIVSCSKKGDPGATGPQGAKGDPGATGSTGATGATGSQGNAGQNGNANVHSQNFTINANQWSHVGTVGQPGDGYELNQSCALINSNIVNTGAVFAYISGDNQTWTALPHTFPTGIGSTYPYSTSVNYQYSINLITVLIQDNDFLTPQPNLPIYLKVMAIASLRLTNPNINWKNYSEVKQHLNL